MLKTEGVTDNKESSETITNLNEEQVKLTQERRRRLRLNRVTNKYKEDKQNILKGKRNTR